MKRLLKAIIKKSGFTIHRIMPSPPPDLVWGNTMAIGLLRLRSLGLDPASIVDVGAAAGTWTQEAANVWPASSFLLFEPLEERKKVLTTLQATAKNKIFLAFAAAGNEEAEVTFHVSDDLDGSGIATDAAASTGNRPVKLTSIDKQISLNGLRPPYAIKLDTHGFEVPILEGSEETLKNTLFVIIECYGFQIAPGSLLFWEMCRLMSTKGFRLFDLVDTMRRPGDKAFWQCDAFFIRNDHPLFSNNRYR
ncbi:MAG TPA: FkbM family methyltransferase [Puia sp.]|nr:FkbM family methyltransferase [Puia sp.]